MPDSPGNKGCPSINSAITQPVDHTSSPHRQSGARNAGRRSQRPTDLGCVIGRAKDQFRRSVVPGADVRNVRFILDQDLGAAKIAELEHSGGRIEQEILRLDIPMADSHGVNVGEGAKELVDVNFDFQDWHRRLHLVEEPGGAINGLRYEFENKVEIDFLLLQDCQPNA